MGNMTPEKAGGLVRQLDAIAEKLDEHEDEGLLLLLSEAKAKLLGDKTKVRARKGPSPFDVDMDIQRALGLETWLAVKLAHVDARIENLEGGAEWIPRKVLERVSSDLRDALVQQKHRLVDVERHVSALANRLEALERKFASTGSPDYAAARVGERLRRLENDVRGNLAAANVDHDAVEERFDRLVVSTGDVRDSLVRLYAIEQRVDDAEMRLQAVLERLDGHEHELAENYKELDGRLLHVEAEEA